MKLVFEAESEQTRFDHVFDLYVGLLVSKQFDKINEMLKYCIEHPADLDLQPAVGMQLLMLTKHEKQIDTAIRSQLFVAIEAIYKKRFPDKLKAFQQVIGGLK